MFVVTDRLLSICPLEFVQSISALVMSHSSTLHSAEGRRCLDPNFRLKSTGRSVRIEVATAEDERRIHEFLNAGFVFDEPMNRAVGKRPALRPFIHSFLLFRSPTGGFGRLS